MVSEEPTKPEPYALEPADPKPGAEPAPAGAASAERAASSVTPAARNAVTEPEAPAAPISRPGMVPWQFPLAVGLTATLTAAALSGVHAENAAHAGAGGRGSAPTWWQASFGIVLWAPISAALGVAALKLVATAVLHRPLGDVRLAAARMFAATGLFYLALNLGMSPSGIEILDRVLTLILAGGVYLGVVWGSFRLSADGAMKVFGAHASAWVLAQLLWLVVPLVFGGGSKQSDARAPAPPAATPAAPVPEAPKPR